MLAVLPAAVTAMQDKALRGMPREVYVWLYQRLDVVRFRRVKQVEIEHAFQVDKSTVSRALRLLVTTGYIDRERTWKEWNYRLVHSNPDREPRSAGSCASAA